VVLAPVVLVPLHSRSKMRQHCQGLRLPVSAVRYHLGNFRGRARSSDNPKSIILSLQLFEISIQSRFTPVVTVHIVGRGNLVHSNASRAIWRATAALEASSAHRSSHVEFDKANASAIKPTVIFVPLICISGMAYKHWICTFLRRPRCCSDRREGKKSIQKD